MSDETKKIYQDYQEITIKISTLIFISIFFLFLMQKFVNFFGEVIFYGKLIDILGLYKIPKIDPKLNYQNFTKNNIFGKRISVNSKNSVKIANNYQNINNNELSQVSFLSNFDNLININKKNKDKNDININLNEKSKFNDLIKNSNTNKNDYYNIKHNEDFEKITENIDNLNIRNKSILDISRFSKEKNINEINLSQTDSNNNNILFSSPKKKINIENNYPKFISENSNLDINHKEITSPIVKEPIAKGGPYKLYNSNNSTDLNLKLQVLQNGHNLSDNNTKNSKNLKVDKEYSKDSKINNVDLEIQSFSDLLKSSNNQKKIRRDSSPQYFKFDKIENKKIIYNNL